MVESPFNPEQTFFQGGDLVQPIRLTIQGMASAGCAEAVEHAVRTVPGVMCVRVDLVGSDVLVEAGESVDVDALLAAVQQAGYIATLAG
jgi:Cu+-exporting ATPase